MIDTPSTQAIPSGAGQLEATIDIKLNYPSKSVVAALFEKFGWNYKDV